MVARGWCARGSFSGSVRPAGASERGWGAAGTIPKACGVPKFIEGLQPPASYTSPTRFHRGLGDAKGPARNSKNFT